MTDMRDRWSAGLIRTIRYAGATVAAAVILVSFVPGVEQIVRGVVL